MSNLKKIKLARKLIEDGKKYYYIKNGKKRIYNSLCVTEELISGGENLLDVGGGDGRKYSFREYTEILCDIKYNYATRHDLDIRTQPLPYENESFDIVVSHETIEHLWLMKMGGMLCWKGIINFWKESYRVLKPGGTFYLSTRNRVSPVALLKVLDNEYVQVSWPRVDGSGHVNELCAKDLRRIAKITNLFVDNTAFSTSSLNPRRQLRVNQRTPRLRKFLDREILQEELYDTIHFISHKT